MINYIIFCIIFMGIVWLMSEVGKQGNYKNHKYLITSKESDKIKEYITYKEFKEIKNNCKYSNPVRLISIKKKYYWKYELNNQSFNLLELASDMRCSK